MSPTIVELTQHEIAQLRALASRRSMSISAFVGSLFDSAVARDRALQRGPFTITID